MSLGFGVILACITDCSPQDVSRDRCANMSVTISMCHCTFLYCLWSASLCFSCDVIVCLCCCNSLDRYHTPLLSLTCRDQRAVCRRCRWHRVWSMVSQPTISTDKPDWQTGEQMVCGQVCASSCPAWLEPTWPAAYATRRPIWFVSGYKVDLVVRSCKCSHAQCCFEGYMLSGVANQVWPQPSAFQALLGYSRECVCQPGPVVP